MNKIKREEAIRKADETFRRLYRKMRNDIHELYGNEVSSNEYLILRLLLENPSMTVTDISKNLVVSLSHITAVSDKLVQKNLIERGRSEKDRRVVELKITESGEQVVKKLMEKRKEYMTMKFSILTDDELEQLDSLLKKLMK